MVSPKVRSPSIWFGSATRISRQIDSASSGSFKYRYNSALAIASPIPDLEMVFSFRSMQPPSVRPGFQLIRRSADLSCDPHQRIVITIDDALLQRNDGIVRDMDVLRTNFRAALRNIA